VNLKLFRDGSDDYSVMPVTVGDHPHSYHQIGLGMAEELAEEFEE